MSRAVLSSSRRYATMQYDIATMSLGLSCVVSQCRASYRNVTCRMALSRVVRCLVARPDTRTCDTTSRHCHSKKRQYNTTCDIAIRHRNISRQNFHLDAQQCDTTSRHFTKCRSATFGSLPWRSSLQHDLVTKACSAHNFVIWSCILKLFHRNDHHIETTSRVQHLGCVPQVQHHSMTL
jgi:hypothetical protein